MVDFTACDGSCVPYQPDLTCCSNWGEFPDEVIARAQELAWSTLRSLSAGRVGNCQVLVRPCAQAPCSACDSLGIRIETGCFTPTPGCGRMSGCSCAGLHEVVLPGLVADVVSVLVDGVALADTAYRIDNGHILLRTDGEPWPSCQSMALDVTEVGTFGVWYVPGIRPDAAGRAAAGILACEFAKACTGGKCRLPATVTTIARQGITMEVGTEGFRKGMTGIREVDAYLASLNPNGLLLPPRIWSPDLAQHRYTTYVGGASPVPPTPVV